MKRCSASLIIAAAAKSLQSFLTLCDPIDSSPLGSPVPGVLQARTLEWVGISFSNAWKWRVKVKSLSCVWVFVTPWTVACYFADFQIFTIVIKVVVWSRTLVNIWVHFCWKYMEIYPEVELLSNMVGVCSSLWETSTNVSWVTSLRWKYKGKN